MTKSKLRGVMNNNDRICSAFKINGFKIINYIYARDYTIYYVSKDYAKKFNIDFNGKITLEVKVNFNFFKCLMPYFYPNFKEISNIIPKNTAYVSAIEIPLLNFNLLSKILTTGLKIYAITIP